MQLIAKRRSIVAVRTRSLRSGEEQTLTADRFVPVAGALGSPHLVLASGLDRLSPAQSAVAAYLTRHPSAAVYGNTLVRARDAVDLVERISRDVRPTHDHDSDRVGVSNPAPKGEHRAPEPQRTRPRA